MKTKLADRCGSGLGRRLARGSGLLGESLSRTKRISIPPKRLFLSRHASTSSSTSGKAARAAKTALFFPGRLFLLFPPVLSGEKKLMSFSSLQAKASKESE